MALVRCPSCRYSFEQGAGETPERCAQCGRSLHSSDTLEPSEAFEEKKTQRMKTIPKPD
jgi:ribosomal protein L34E